MLFDKMLFQEKLKKLRNEKGISQYDLAKELNISRSVIAKWETGLSMPSEESIELLVKYFDITREELFNDEKINHILVGKNKIIKNQNVLIVVMSIILLFSILIISFYCIPKKYNIVVEDVKQISVCDEKYNVNFIINDFIEMKFIIDNINSIKWNRSGISLFSNDSETRYTLSIINNNGKKIDEICIVNKYLIRNSFFFYNNSNIPINCDFLQELENKYTALPYKPENTELDFWITDNVSNVNLNSYEKVIKPENYGLKKAIFGKGYSSTLDDAGNEILPEHYVIYSIGSYPNDDSIDEYINGIYITDPNVYLFGINVSVHPDVFCKIFEELGYEVRNIDESEKRFDRLVIKDGIVIRFNNFETRAISIIPDYEIYSLW